MPAFAGMTASKPSVAFDSGQSFDSRTSAHSVRLALPLAWERDTPPAIAREAQGGRYLRHNDQT